MNKILLVVMYCIGILCLSGCGIFKKTNKERSKIIQSATNQLEASQLVLKSADKETQVFTYWNDSGFYQYQQIKERVDLAKTGKIAIEEKKEVTEKHFLKQTQPVSTWLYVGAIALLFVAVFLYRRGKRLI